MQLQVHFYLHITGGLAGEAAPLMARIALNLGHDARAFPVDISEIQALGQFRRDPNTCGLNEYFVADFLRAAAMEEIRPWRDAEVEELKQTAGVKQRATLHVIKASQDR